MDSLSRGEAAAVTDRDRHVPDKANPRPDEEAELDFALAGWRARANAVLEGGYLLIPPDGMPSPKLFGDANVHFVTAPGGIRDGRHFRTLIIIDLDKHGVRRGEEEVRDAAHRTPRP